MKLLGCGRTKARPIRTKETEMTAKVLEIHPESGNGIDAQITNEMRLAGTIEVLNYDRDNQSAEECAIRVYREMTRISNCSTGQSSQ